MHPSPLTRYVKEELRAVGQPLDFCQADPEQESRGVTDCPHGAEALSRVPGALGADAVA